MSTDPQRMTLEELEQAGSRYRQALRRYVDGIVQDRGKEQAAEAALASALLTEEVEWTATDARVLVEVARYHWTGDEQPSLSDFMEYVQGS